ncbi:hypothetical protein [Stenomitos frigidus]|uniref:hypothetical protein n=1 Tax=Stenomitos frigidus TaxID=1886765 RepID=UPI0015E6A2A4|nr:hypothetical protein [Stenomitos frigidus]
MQAATASPCQYIQEQENAFLALFPHRYDYIWAEHPDPQGKVEWKTESRHPLSDRLIHQGAYLYGVRFGAETQYCLLDIDAGSLYHPKRDPFAIARILEALEPLGLVSAIACTSSYSGGIHLYFPFEQPQKTWELSLALQAVLENAGFKPALGQLELFPNARLFVTEGTPNLYAAHRLPMQAGSYILSDAWELTNSNQTTFVQHWRFAQRRNDVSAKALQRVLKVARRKRYTLSGKADKFLNDLNADIEPGWSDFGQTNFLLGRITMRSYIFGHLLYGCEPLAGKALVHDIVRVAKTLPGYEDWCRHQSGLEQRAEEWAQCVEASHYFPFGQTKTPPTALVTAKAAVETLTWNQQRSEGARDRIRQAIADLLNHSNLPSHATARFQALTRYGIGGGSLYRHRDLWHPVHLVEKPPDPPNILSVSSMASAAGAPIEGNPKSLLSDNDGNSRSSESLSDSLESDRSSTDGNSLPAKEASDHVSADASIQPVEEHEGLEGIRYVRQVLAAIQERHQASREAAKLPVQAQQRKQKDTRAAQMQRMQQYWDSGDRILMAEAQRWAIANPGVLDLPAPLEAQPQQGEPSILADPPMGRALLQPGHSVQSMAASEAFEQESAVPIDEGALGIVDLSDVLAQISVQRQRLGWTSEQVQEALSQHFGKASQALLTDLELMEWLTWLRGQARSTD